MRAVAGFLLVVVVAWALAAVLLLTGTLVSADDIDDSVEQAIVPRTREINQDLEAVRLAKDTARIARQIHREAAPLDEQLGRIVDETGEIKRSSGRILDTAAAIDNEVASINATVASINSTVRRLQDVVVSIDAVAGAILATVRGIYSEAASVDASVAGIRNRLAAVRQEARSIDDGVRGINVNARKVIDVVAVIERDLTRVRRHVETHSYPDTPQEYPAEANIQGHAHSIDCRLSTLNPTPPTPPEYCRPPAGEP